MPNHRSERISQISEKLGKRKLVWFGTRGADSWPLSELKQFSEVFSIIAPTGSVSLQLEVSLETLKKERVDLELYSLDLDTSPEARNFRKRMFVSLREPSVVATYRPSEFFTAIYYPQSESIEYLGLFHEKQAPFEHKPWVESELRKLGVRTVPWRYYAEHEKDRLISILGQEQFVLRSNRSDGGAGLVLVNNAEDVEAFWPSHVDSFMGVAPYMFPNIPLNVNACVFRDGVVSLHSPSLQLIGISGLTNRKFGYCGNDFAQVCELGPEVVDQLEDIARTAGRWLARNGYVGAFGVDAILCEDKVYLTEINPRFQGSSSSSARLDQALERADVFLEHLAAFFDLPSPSPFRLWDIAIKQEQVSQIVYHNCTSTPMVRNSQIPQPCDMDLELLPSPGTRVDPDAALFRAIVKGSVTHTGLTVESRYSGQLGGFAAKLFDSPEDDRQI